LSTPDNSRFHYVLDPLITGNLWNVLIHGNRTVLLHLSHLHCRHNVPQSAGRIIHWYRLVVKVLNDKVEA